MKLLFVMIFQRIGIRFVNRPKCGKGGVPNSGRGVKGNGATFTLQKCIAGNVLQELRNDYTNIRNNLRPVTLGAYKKVDKVLTLTGELLHGKVSLCSGASCIAPSSWSHWAYFPNTNQLRNQYVTIPKLGYPKCLSVV